MKLIASMAFNLCAVVIAVWAIMVILGPVVGGIFSLTAIMAVLIGESIWEKRR